MDGVITVLGVSHHTAALPVLERVALGDADARRLLHHLGRDARVREALVLSTCNRTEIYAVAAAGDDGGAALREALQRHTGLGAAALACSSYLLAGPTAVEHLFRVAAGLDSAVLGESEIVGQLRTAATRAERAGVLGAVLGGAVHHALLAGRRVRRRAGLGRGSTSLAVLVGKAAVAARGDRPVLLVGTGALGRSVARVVAGLGAPLVVINRTYAEAQGVAALHGATAVPWSAIDDALADAGAVVTATGAPEAVLGAAQLDEAVRTGGRTLTVFDLAVPRDVEPAAGSVDGVVLQDLDQLHHRLEANQAARRAAVEAARSVVAAEVARFEAWQRDQAVAPAVRAAWRRAERLRREELARCGPLTAEERVRLERVTASLVRRLLDEPTRRLRATADPGAPHLDVFRELFAADDAPALRVVDGDAA